jgi:hypothetical protein
MNVSFLGWVDYDESYEAAARNAVASLRGRDAREELGTGGLRDTLSDLFSRARAPFSAGCAISFSCPGAAKQQ